MDIGRNEPCPCGSGKKFKKCCGLNTRLSSQSTQSHPLSPHLKEMNTGTKLDSYFDAFAAILSFTDLLKTHCDFGEDLTRVAESFEERFHPGTEFGLPDSFYLNWFVLDNRFGVDQKTATERFMEEKEFRGSTDDRKTLIRDLAESYGACYQIIAKDTRVIRFKELGTRRVVVMNRVGDSYELDAAFNDVWYARFVGPDHDAYCFCSPYIFPPEVKDDFTNIVLHQIKRFEEYMSTRSLTFKMPRDAFKAGAMFWAEYFLRSSPCADKTMDLDKEIQRQDWPVMVTTDGEKIRFSTVIFKMLDQQQVRTKLARVRNLDFDEKEDCWIWYKKGNRRMKSWETTLLGRVFIKDDRLIGEVNSVERALRLKNKLTKTLGCLVEFDRVESKDFNALPPSSDEEMRDFEKEQAKLHADPQVQEEILKMQKQYYLHDWIKAKIPALDNKTPLQAKKTSHGQLQLEDLINQMEMRSQMGPDYLPKLDMNFLREALGLPVAKRK